MKHVYGNRNKVKIVLRAVKHKIFLLLKAIFKRKSNDRSETAVCYPVFTSKESLNDILNRLAWAFPNEANINIYYGVEDEEFDSFDSLNLSKQYNYVQRYHNFIKKSEKALSRKLNDSDIIFVHSYSALFRWKVFKNFSKIRIIDPNYYAVTEGNELKFGLYNSLSTNDKKPFKELSRDNFRKLVERSYQIEKSYLFLTGPSFDSYKDFKFEENSLKIVCNTIIKDHEFLDYIGGPDIIAFADPVFHFGTSNYAARFRELVIETVEKYKSYVVVPAATVPLMIYNYPVLKDRIIGLSNTSEINFPSIDKLKTKASGSIISFLMLPLAVSLSKKIYLLGADGRSPDENYFWKHNDKVQLSDLMDSVFLTHPSFFRDRVYEDHYEEHCRYLEKMIVAAEKKGKSIHSLTKSFVPVLSERYYKEIEDSSNINTSF